MRTWKYVWRLVRFVPLLYALLAGLWVVAFAVPLASGWVLRAFFNTLTGDAPARLGLWALVALMVVVPIARELVRIVVFANEPVLMHTVGALLQPTASIAADSATTAPALNLCPNIGFPVLLLSGSWCLHV